MRPARNGFDHLRHLAAGAYRVGLIGIDVAETKTRLTLDYQEFFRLGMMIMTAACNPGMGGEIGKLTGIPGLQHFDKLTPWIFMLDQRICELFGGKVGNVG